MRRAFLAAILSTVVAASPAPAADHPIGDGAWSWFGDPRAVTHDGSTYVGWVDQEGDIKVRSYDHTTGERVTAVLHARLQQDDHANPSIQVRADGRLVVYYSAHVGPAMHFRVSSQPEDVTAWDAPQTVDENTPGGFGYTYPNPVRLEDEDATYLFWRGGNYNPTFSILEDGSGGWSDARTLITNPGSRPYVKYDTSGGDTIHVAYTNLHPGEQANIVRDSNIYYARVRAGRIERVGGEQVGSLDDPIEPAEGSLVWDGAPGAWIHDVAADPSGNPVLVFASFPTVTDHRYHYARWTGSAWQVTEITGAGGSIAEEPGRSPRYSGGITLDHEDPSRIYLSRQVGSDWRVETQTTPDGGASWTVPTVLSAGGKNVRPVSPRGMVATGGDHSVIWMSGGYFNYEDYDTAIHAFTPIVANAPPVADAEPNVRSGPADLDVTFGTGGARDPDGSIANYAWDFDANGTTDSTEPEPTHTYTAGGRYFPTLTVTDDDGASSTFVEEILVGLPVAPEAHTGGAAGSTVHGALDAQNQDTDWHFEYGPTEEYGATTTAQTLAGGGGLEQVEATLPGLEAGRVYHYRLVAENPTGAVSGDDRVFVAGSAPSSDAYRDAVLATAGLADYWRLGELEGTTSRDETSATTGSLLGRFVLGQPGVLGPLRNPAASFDGVGAELAIGGSALGEDATVEGWFRWRSGRTVLRDNTGPNRGWMPALAGGTDQAFLTYRVGGPSINTGDPISLVRDGEWHHVVVTKNGSSAALYVDGTQEHSTTAATDSGDPAVSPWHVMRNGTNDAYSAGEADELALYTRALTASEVNAHYDLAQDLADDPLPDPPPGGGGTPPGNGSPPTEGSDPSPELNISPEVDPGPPPAPGLVRVARRRLIVRGAPGVANRLTVRRRGRRWIVRDRRAALRPGRRCRRLSPRAVSCRAAGVRRLLVYGGAGHDRLTVIGRARVTFRGGPGRDTQRRRLR